MPGFAIAAHQPAVARAVIALPFGPVQATLSLSPAVTPERSRVSKRTPWFALLGLVLLAGCGGGDDSATTAAAATATAAPTRALALAAPAEPVIAPVVGRGEFKSATRLASFTAPQVIQGLVAAGPLAPAVAPRYAVSTWRLTYITLDGRGQPVLASGLAAVPDKPAGQASPVVSYQHGTIFHDAEAPSNALLATEPPIVMASLGAIVVAPDYVGYGASRGSQHPYLLSAPSAAAVLDLLTAARIWRASAGLLGNGQLFLLGYSEGGYVTMAAHRAIQTDASPHAATLIGSVPGGGPYDVQVTLDTLLQRVRDQSPVLGALISPGLLGNLGSSLRNEVRRQLLKQLIPDDADVSFQSTFIDNFLADDAGAIERQSNVHNWKPLTPIRMFHGRDDQTVPYPSASHTLAAMLARGAPNVLLTDCAAKPAGHRECVLPYWSFMVQQVGSVIRDL